MQSFKQITLAEALRGARNGSNYFTGICPYCGAKEFWFYKDDVKKLTDGEVKVITGRCNRQNHCGKSARIILDEKPLPEIVNHPTEITMSRDISNWLGCECLGDTSEYAQEYRGIPKELFQKYHIQFRGFQGLLQEGASRLKNVGKDAYYNEKFDSDFYNRDILIPLCNMDSGIVERIMLRKREGEDYGRKELNLPLKPNKATELWNGQVLHYNHYAETERAYKYFFVTEGIFDAMSIIAAQVPDVTAVAVTGCKKWGHVMKAIEHLSKEEQEKIVIMINFDDDEAGIKYAAQFASKLDSLSINYRNVKFGYKDANEALQNNGVLWMKDAVEQMIVE